MATKTQSLSFLTQFNLKIFLFQNCSKLMQEPSSLENSNFGDVQFQNRKRYKAKILDVLIMQVVEVMLFLLLIKAAF